MKKKSALVKFRIDELLNFFNNKNSDSSEVSTINGLLGEELVIRLFINYYQAVCTKANILFGEKPIERSEGKKKKQLDYWVKTESKLFQVEVKNWSIKSYGVNKNKYFDGVNNFNQFIGKHFSKANERISKVLREMKPPSISESKMVEPLLCFWFPINSSNNNSPFFQVPVKTKKFKRCHIFSASNYLNELHHQNKKVIELEMPVYLKKIERMNKLIKNNIDY